MRAIIFWFSSVLTFVVRQPQQISHLLTVRQIEQSRNGPFRSHALPSKSADERTQRLSRFASAIVCEKHFSTDVLQFFSLFLICSHTKEKMRSLQFAEQTKTQQQKNLPTITRKLLLERLVFCVEFTFEAIQIVADCASCIALLCGNERRLENVLI